MVLRSAGAWVFFISACGSVLAPDGGLDAGRDAATRDAAALDAQIATDAAQPLDSGPPPPIRVLLFSYTNGYRHASIADGITAFADLAAARGWQLEASEDPTRFTDASLSAFDVLVFLSTTGDLLDPSQQSALERWVEAGGGWVGVHAAADAEYDWPWYGELVGAWFLQHPAIQEATLTVDTTNPITSHLSSTWTRTDEWYDFRRNPREWVTVLMTIDESTYSGGVMGADHPMTWLREYDGGRSFYTELGHTPESYADPAFRTMLTLAVEWAAQSP